MTQCQQVDYQLFMYQEYADRMSAFLIKSGYSQAELARTTGINAATISRIQRGSQVMGKNVIAAISKSFDVNVHWLETGIGEMGSCDFKNNWIDGNEPPEVQSGAKENESPYNARSRGSSSKQNMWWVPAKAEAGFVRGFPNRIFPSQIERISMPLIQGECFGFEVAGFSMFPEYLPGSYIVCTLLEDSSWLRKGKIYVFQTIDGLIIKFFDRIEDGNVYLTSANNNYNPVEPIPLTELQQLYNIEFDMMKPKH